MDDMHMQRVAADLADLYPDLKADGCTEALLLEAMAHGWNEAEVIDAFHEACQFRDRVDATIAAAELAAELAPILEAGEASYDAVWGANRQRFTLEHLEVPVPAPRRRWRRRGRSTPDEQSA